MKTIPRLLIYLQALALTFITNGAFSQNDSRPNILWITSEDNSPLLGCYGDKNATTPSLDQLAREGFLYTRAYANCPVCAPARNTIITGVYAASNGNEHMRSTYPSSDQVQAYSSLLMQAGYYCINNLKTDYNTSSIDPAKVWDESSAKAHYKNRPDGKPFFAIFNLMESHESRIFPPGAMAGRPGKPVVPKHNPAAMVLAPYHPDIPEMRHDWAVYYDQVEIMDARVGELLRELETLGEAENTIVFYYGDHGGVLARSKRYIYETGTRVPFIVRIPDKYKELFPAGNPGNQVDRMISFVDLAPTLMSIIGAEIPDFMQGDAFLGKQTTPEPEYLHMTRQRMDERIDMARAVRDKKYRYIRNYMPFRIPLQHLDFLFMAPSAQAWEDAFFAGQLNEIQRIPFLPKAVEELYDTENDPWEVNNLAGDPAYKEVLERMRAENRAWMEEIRDVGLIPETEYEALSGEASMYDYMRSDACPFDELLEAAEKATFPEADIPAYVKYLKHEHPAIRYWGAVGLLIHKKQASPETRALLKASGDKSSSVAIITAETLYELGETEAAIEAYIRILTDTSYGMMDRNFALNSIDGAHIYDEALTRVVEEFHEANKEGKEGFARFNAFDWLMSDSLLKKWDKI
ncbi:MAG: sulfatase [Bacteroidales bacterium]|nr:sulfatase [Bacteroidales bacterium]